MFRSCFSKKRKEPVMLFYVKNVVIKKTARLFFLWVFLFDVHIKRSFLFKAKKEPLEAKNRNDGL